MDYKKQGTDNACLEIQKVPTTDTYLTQDISTDLSEINHSPLNKKWPHRFQLMRRALTEKIKTPKHLTPSAKSEGHQVEISFTTGEK